MRSEPADEVGSEVSGGWRWKPLDLLLKTQATGCVVWRLRVSRESRRKGVRREDAAEMGNAVGRGSLRGRSRGGRGEQRKLLAGDAFPGCLLLTPGVQTPALHPSGRGDAGRPVPSSYVLLGPSVTFTRWGFRCCWYLLLASSYPVGIGNQPGPCPVTVASPSP